MSKNQNNNKPAPTETAAQKIATRAGELLNKVGKIDHPLAVELGNLFNDALEVELPGNRISRQERTNRSAIKFSQTISDLTRYEVEHYFKSGYGVVRSPGSNLVMIDKDGNFVVQNGELGGAGNFHDETKPVQFHLFPPLARLEELEERFEAALKRGADLKERVAALEKKVSELEESKANKSSFA